jgi:hypothetical protein
MSTSDDDNSIGYKKPPKSSRFKPGKSGNPKGRPVGSKKQRFNAEYGSMVKDALNKALNKKIYGRENNKTVGKKTIEVILMKLAQLAVQGDMAATDKIINLHNSFKKEEEENLMKSLDIRFKSIEALIAKRFTCQSEESLCMRDLYRYYSYGRVLREVYGEKEVPYVEFEPRTELHWRRLEDYIDDIQNGVEEPRFFIERDSLEYLTSQYFQNNIELVRQHSPRFAAMMEQRRQQEIADILNKQSAAKNTKKA